jgi:hypothetical protein
MTKVEESRQRILASIGATGRAALVVEGVDDLDAFRLLLNKRDRNWESRWVLEQAQGKKNAKALAALVKDKYPQWRIIIDRDEATAEELSTLQQELPNLKPLPRFCIESYVSDPAELWEALPVAIKPSKPDAFAQFYAELTGPLSDWRRHAALWNVINPLWSRLRAEGFNDQVLQPDQVPDDATLRSTLTTWSDVVNAERVFAAFEAEQARVAALDETTFVRTTLYAKKFYPLVVHQVLNRWIGQRSEKAHRTALFQTLPLPADLEPIWNWMGLA